MHAIAQLPAQLSAAGPAPAPSAAVLPVASGVPASLSPAETAPSMPATQVSGCPPRSDVET
eukprot:11392384-Prorocentrum_lima.AAC.1